jgi:hypothetical protein
MITKDILRRIENIETVLKPKLKPEPLSPALQEMMDKALNRAHRTEATQADHDKSTR